MRTRSKRQATALATAKSKAKRMTEEVKRMKETQTRNAKKVSCRSPSPTPTESASTPSTPPQSPRISPGMFGGPRQDTFRSSFTTKYTIGHAIYSLKQDDRKKLAEKIIACRARGNGFAADIMKRQMADILEEERDVWRRQAERDRQIALEQIELLRNRQRIGAVDVVQVDGVGVGEGDLDSDRELEV
ncbi:hypothetical protein BDY19DRAFT_970204, partial [Irpex rosettiformis]